MFAGTVGVNQLTKRMILWAVDEEMKVKAACSRIGAGAPEIREIEVGDLRS